MSLKKYTRVRFTKQTDTLYSTSHEFLGGTKVLIGVVDLASMKASILEHTDEEVMGLAVGEVTIQETNITNLAGGKKAVRIMLENNGVNFFAEVRNRDKAVVDG
jgi:hypothetical protein